MDDASIANARAARSRTSECLRSLSRGHRTLPGVLRSPPGPLKKATLWRVLTATYNLGPAGARKVCEDAKVWPHVALDELKPSEVQAILENLPERVK